jgi:hypothetical protein
MQFGFGHVASARDLAFNNELWHGIAPLPRSNPS